MIVIQSSEIIQLLTEGLPAESVEPITEEQIFTCEGVTVARAVQQGDRWKATSMACAEACHGPHPRYADAYRRLRERYGRLMEQFDPAACPKCGGSGWLHVDSDEARQQFVLVVTFQMFRGVALAEDGYEASDLNAEYVHDTIATFLSGGVPTTNEAAVSDDAGGARDKGEGL